MFNKKKKCKKPKIKIIKSNKQRKKRILLIILLILFIMLMTVSLFNEFMVGIIFGGSGIVLSLILLLMTKRKRRKIKEENITFKKSFLGSVSIVGRLVSVAAAIYLIVIAPTKEELRDFGGLCSVFGWIIIGMWILSLVYKLYYIPKNSCILIKSIGMDEYESLTKILVINETRWFRCKQEVRELKIEPGAYISIKQTLKGKIFRYGDLVLYFKNRRFSQVLMKKVCISKRNIEKITKEEILLNNINESKKSRCTPYAVITAEIKPDLSKYKKVNPEPQKIENESIEK